MTPSMPISFVTVVVLSVIVAYAKGHEQRCLDNVVRKFTAGMIDKLFDRVLKASLLHHADADTSTLRKPGQVSILFRHILLLFQLILVLAVWLLQLREVQALTE